MDKYIITTKRRKRDNSYQPLVLDGKVVMGSYKKVKQVLDDVNLELPRRSQCKIMKVDNRSDSSVIVEAVGVVDLE